MISRAMAKLGNLVDVVKHLKKQLTRGEVVECWRIQIDSFDVKGKLSKDRLDG